MMVTTEGEADRGGALPNIPGIPVWRRRVLYPDAGKAGDFRLAESE